ncbi:MAG: hypothetical protein E7225_02950 [Clostridiales bacterium]|nr:hypothetical protein [Clostridiales bacterium]
MKRKALAILVVVMVLGTILTGCGPKECEHEFTEANYQTPATCTLCGVTEGEVLTPDFETYGIEAYMEPGNTYNYKTICMLDESMYTIGKATVSHAVIPDDEEHEAKEGYEWHKVDFNVLFDDDNAKTCGVAVNFLCEDYYNIKDHDDSADHSDPDISVYTANVNGEDMPVYLRQGGGFTQNDDYSATFDLTFEVHMPAGYDGIVVGLVNQELLADGNAGYINTYYTGDTEEFLLFRIK